MRQDYSYTTGKGGVSLDLRASPGVSIPTDHRKQAIAGSESTQAQTPQGEDLGHLLTKQPWKGWLRVREVWKGSWRRERIAINCGLRICCSRGTVAYCTAQSFLRGRGQPSLGRVSDRMESMKSISGSELCQEGGITDSTLSTLGRHASSAMQALARFLMTTACLKCA